jgi:hypothetical protein
VSFSALLASADKAALAILGGSVTYAPSAGAPVTVRGVFDAAYVRVDAGQAGISSSGPAVFLRLADLPTDPEDDAAMVTVDAVQFRVRECQKDGLGGVLLLLHRA